MHPLLNIAVSAARSAGNLIMRHYDRIDELTVETKSRNDFVTEVDRAAEARVIEHIHRNYPDHAILGEEGGASGDHEVVWIIDPLDGTTNFLHGFPQFAVSIGIQVRGTLEHGVVYNPHSQELFTATRGRGAALDGRRIRVSRARGLEGALLGTGFPFREDQDLDAYMAVFTDILRQTAGVRRAGAAALDLAFIAAGRLDGFWELGLKPWDMAAGILLIREAGGLVGDITGRGDPMDTGNIIAGNPRVYEALGGILQRHMRPGRT